MYRTQRAAHIYGSHPVAFTNAAVQQCSTAVHMIRANFNFVPCGRMYAPATSSRYRSSKQCVRREANVPNASPNHRPVPNILIVSSAL